MTEPTRSAVQHSIRRHLLLGVTFIAVLGAGVGGWAATTDIAGAVVTPGLVVVESNVKKVQHPTGGIVGEIRVREGDRVKAGDLIMRLDETLTRANLSIVVKSLDELAARQARLEAERDSLAAMSLPESLQARAGLPEVARLMQGEETLFQLRRAAREGQKSQLQERSLQLAEEVRGLTAQEGAKRREIELIKQELEGVHDLWRRNLVPITRLTALEREAARLEGERGQIIAGIAQAKGKMTETGLQITQIDQDLRSEVAKELREIQAKSAELVERKVAAEDQLRRVDIRAPLDGVIHQLDVHTVGGVIRAGDTIALVVPDADMLTVEAKVEPQDIDQVRIGQLATLRLSAFSQHSTPELNGTVSRISADLTTDQRTGVGFYTIRIALDDAERQKLGDLRLLPGMPVEAFVKTADRTVLSYLVKPLTDQVAKAFREE